MTSAFNPYMQWLGLNIASQPDCYTLFGLPWYEADPAKILAAADQAYARVQVQQAGINEAMKQALLSEILTARACLLDPTSKATYDHQLQMTMQQYQQSTMPMAPQGSQTGYIDPMAPAGAVPAQAMPPQGISSQPAMPAAASPMSPQAPIGGNKSAASLARSKAKSGNKSFLGYGVLALILLGGIYVGSKYLPQKEEDPVVINKPDNTPVTPVSNPPEEKPNNPEITIPGKRPTAADLAGQVPGLGNPDEKMENIPDEPEMVAPVRVQPTADQVNLLEQTIRQAWSQLGERDPKGAQTVLRPMNALPKTEAGENELLRLTLLVEHLVTFDNALAKGLQKFMGGEQLQVGSTQLTVVSNSDDRLVIRLAGQTKSYDKKNIPDGLARAIALKEMKEDETTKKAIEGCFVMFSPLADPDHAENIWTAGGVSSSEYLAIKADKFKYLGNKLAASGSNMTSVSTTQPNPMPNPGTTVPENMVAGSGNSDKEKAIALGKLMQDTRNFLTERNIPAAKQSLMEATKIVELDAHKLKLDRLTQLVELSETFWQSVQNQLQELQSDEVITVKETIANVVEYTPDGLLILRVGGENKRYTMANMPAGLAKYFATRQMAEGDPNGKAIIGAFLLLEPNADVAEVRSLWQESMLAGVDLQSLMPVIDDQYNLADDLLVQVAVPSDSELADVTAEFQAQWMQEFAKVQRASDRAELAKKLHESGLKNEDGSKLQYVIFRYALSEAAKGGDFNLGDQIIRDWSKRFTINPWTWQTNMANLAAGASTSAAFHQALAEHLVSLAPSFIDADNPETLSTILKIADASSKISRNNELIDSVEKLLEQYK